MLCCHLIRELEEVAKVCFIQHFHISLRSRITWGYLLIVAFPVHPLRFRNSWICDRAPEFEFNKVIVFKEVWETLVTRITHRYCLRTEICKDVGPNICSLYKGKSGLIHTETFIQTLIQIINLSVICAIREE